MKTDGDLRMLGNRDGLLHALVSVDMKIDQIDGPYQKINPRHTRKIAERERVLRPLRELRDRYKRETDECLAAWEKSRQEIQNP